MAGGDRTTEKGPTIPKEEMDRTIESMDETDEKDLDQEHSWPTPPFNLKQDIGMAEKDSRTGKKHDK